MCVLVGAVIGRCCRKRKRPCKVHHYQPVNNNNDNNNNINNNKGEKAVVEVEEREFYPYYVAASV